MISNNNKLYKNNQSINYIINDQSDNITNESNNIIKYIPSTKKKK